VKKKKLFIFQKRILVKKLRNIKYRPHCALHNLFEIFFCAVYVVRNTNKKVICAVCVIPLLSSSGIVSALIGSEGQCGMRNHKELIQKVMSSLCKQMFLGESDANVYSL
jgi:hypothetical protein